MLARLRQSLTAATNTPMVVTQAIAGLGGLGKTQLAVEYAYQHAKDYQIVWWVRAEQETTILDDLAALAAKLGLPEANDSDKHKALEAVCDALSARDDDWLLIYDNAENPDSIRHCLPTHGGGHVLITSRHAHWGGVAGELPIDVFTPDESVDFLVNRTGKEDRAEAGRLAEALGHLPLALEQAAAYLVDTGTSFADYVSLFKTRQPAMLKRGTPEFYEKTVAATWEINFRELKKQNRAAAQFVILCSFLAPDRISVKVIREQSRFMPWRLRRHLRDDLKTNALIANLTRHSLVKHDDGLLYIHRLVQAVARNRLSKDDQRGWVERAVKVLNKAFPYKENDLATWDPSAELLPHVLAVNDHTEEVEFTGEPLGRILNEAGLFVGVRADFSTSRVLREKALALAEKDYGPDDPIVATRANNLGRVLQDLGDLPGAKENIERALRIDEKVYGPDHPEVATDANNLGTVLRALGDLQGAKANLERALPIFEKVLGPDHPNVATLVNNLGSVLRDLGDLPGAKAHFERALRIDEKAFGLDHPNVATDANNLGSVLQDLGDLPRAKAHLERALRILEKAFGKEHPNVATCANNLGLVLLDLGDLSGAKECAERALRIDENAFGPDHPSVAMDVHNLGVVLQDLGDLRGAKAHYERALRIDEKVLGPDHPSVARDANNLGSVLQDLGDLSGAKECAERALRIASRVFGDDHPTTKTFRKNLQIVEEQIKKKA
jgi:tetratricopeptide (TPR) repeat protein